MHKCKISETPQGITKRKLKLGPVVVPFGPDSKKPPMLPEKLPV